MKNKSTVLNKDKPPGRLYVVGLGPGDLHYLSKRAIEVINSVEVVVGYRTYIAFIEELLEGKQVISSGMKTEMDRVNQALQHVMDGRSTAIVSSGDAGIYGMAGLTLEICKKNNLRVKRAGEETKQCDLIMEIIPGTPAFCAAASLLGAPLMHDFAVISLSDLLTPWEVISNRIKYAAKADLVLVFYNPKSKSRDWQLNETREILLSCRNKNTPVGIVKRAMREGQVVHVTTLSGINVIDVDMQTVIIVGNSRTYRFGDFIVTPRGYLNKYMVNNDIESEKS